MTLNKKRGLFRSTSRLFLRPNNEKAADQALINAAFIRAKAAVQYDAEGQVQLALEAYAETIGLLCQVKHETTTTPLQHIVRALSSFILLALGCFLIPFEIFVISMMLMQIGLSL